MSISFAPVQMSKKKTNKNETSAVKIIAVLSSELELFSIH